MVALGASFAHNHLSSLDIDPHEAIKEFTGLGLKYIRLGCYWDEIEKEEGVYDFGKIEKLIDLSHKMGLQIVLTVGMKAQRYPEYYIPEWIKKDLNLGVIKPIDKNNPQLKEKVLAFIEKTIEHFENKNIEVWQIENEPLDPSGEHAERISYDLLKEEVELARGLAPKTPVAINLWGNELKIRKVYKKAAALADIVGLDIYLRHPNPAPIFKRFKPYLGPLDSKSYIKNVVNDIQKQGKKVWIMELQSEPWESGELTTNKENPGSFLPEHVEKNIEYALGLEPDVIMLWGFEYWLSRREQGNSRYWDEAKRVIQLHK